MVYFLAAIFALGIFAYIGALLRLITPRDVQNNVKDEFAIYNELLGDDDHGHGGHH